MKRVIASVMLAVTALLAVGASAAVRRNLLVSVTTVSRNQAGGGGGGLLGYEGQLGNQAAERHRP